MEGADIFPTGPHKSLPYIARIYYQIYPHSSHLCTNIHHQSWGSSHRGRQHSSLILLIGCCSWGRCRSHFEDGVHTCSQSMLLSGRCGRHRRVTPWHTCPYRGSSHICRSGRHQEWQYRALSSWGGSFPFLISPLGSGTLPHGWQTHPCKTSTQPLHHRCSTWALTLPWGYTDTLRQHNPPCTPYRARQFPPTHIPPTHLHKHCSAVSSLPCRISTTIPLTRRSLSPLHNDCHQEQCRSHNQSMSHHWSLLICTLSSPSCRSYHSGCRWVDSWSTRCWVHRRCTWGL